MLRSVAIRSECRSQSVGIRIRVLLGKFAARRLNLEAVQRKDVLQGLAIDSRKLKELIVFYGHYL